MFGTGMDDSRDTGRSSRSVAVLHRRRRAALLAGLAVLALVVGVVMGVAARPGGRRGQLSAARTGALKRQASRAAHVTRAEASTPAGRLDEAINRTIARTPIVRMAGTEHREIALTFDDGPGPYTPQILAVLRRTHTVATFFEVGAGDRYFATSTAQIVASGDPIGDHTETHAPMSRLPFIAQSRELLEEAAAIGRSDAPFPRLFRPPYGVWDRATLRLLREYHMLMVLWSVDTDDWERPGTAAIVSAALEGAKPGAIILMHDAGGDRSETIAALPQIIQLLRHRGYRLVTVPRLLLDNPAPQRQDVDSLKGQGG